MKKVLSVILSLLIVLCIAKKSVSVEVYAADESVIKFICKEFLKNAQKMGQVCDGIKEVRCGLSFFASIWHTAKNLFKEEDKSAGFTRAYQKLEDDIEKSEQMGEKLRGVSYILSFFASIGIAAKSLCDNLSSKVFESSKAEKTDKGQTSKTLTNKPKVNGITQSKKGEGSQHKGYSKI